jgi:uncharacterized protein involved in type VI secretion and phage assembly
MAEGLTIIVDQNRTETVQGNETITIDNNRTETVQGNETITIDKNRTETVHGNETVTVGMNRAQTAERGANRRRLADAKSFKIESAVCDRAALPSG